MNIAHNDYLPIERDVDDGRFGLEERHRVAYDLLHVRARYQGARTLRRAVLEEVFQEFFRHRALVVWAVVTMFSS
jgi:hypothetical protein